MNMLVQQHPAPEVSPFNDGDAFKTAQRVGTAMAASTIVPKDYQNNLPNVLIAMEVAHRIGASPMAVMQSLHIIQGRPSWSASFLIATVNACGRFSPLRFEVEGDDPEADSYRVRAVAKDKDSDEQCVGPWITWKMVKAEGWSKKNGSKWLTMPALMFMYRAAAFWTRVYAPELSLGIHTEDEVQDITAHYAGTSEPKTAALVDLNETLRERAANAVAVEPVAEPAEDAAPAMPDPPKAPAAPSAQEVHDALTKAKTSDELDEAGDLIRSVPDEEARKSLLALYGKRKPEVK